MSKVKKNIIKIILLGESGVGKTCLIQSFMDKEFSNTTSTFSFEYMNKEIVKDNIKYNIHIWDTAGQERFRSLSKIFIKDSQIVILVYDITNQKSFDELPFWVNYAKGLLGENVIIGVVGNKIDLFDKIEGENDEENQIVDKEKAQKYSNEIKALFREVSAKENAKGFQEYINELIDLYLSKRKVPENELDAVPLDKNKKKEKRKFC